MKLYTFSAYSTATIELSTKCLRSGLLCFNSRLLSLVLIVIMLEMVNGEVTGQITQNMYWNFDQATCGGMIMTTFPTNANLSGAYTYTGNCSVITPGEATTGTAPVNQTAGTAVRKAIANGDNNIYYWNFTLTGSSLSSLSNYHLYFQMRRSLSGQTYSPTISYSVNGGAYTGALSMSVGDANTWVDYNYYFSGITGASTSLTFRIQWQQTGTGACNVDLDNFQVQSGLFLTSGIFTTPSGVRRATVEVWGGGGGAGASTSNARGGGGGGAYARKVLAGISGNYTVSIGSGGSPGNAGTLSYFNSNSLTDANSVVAAGGSAGGDNGGAGGTVAASNGTIESAGGVGGNRNNDNGGGGGGQAGCAAETGTAGQTGGSSSGGLGGGQTGNTGLCINSGAGGNGGGDSGDNYNNDGSNGSIPGGGGGGCGDNTSWSGNGASGSGASGLVLITWDCPSIALTSGSSTQTVCANTAITNIVYTLGDNYVAANVTGLPSGVTYNIVENTLTISGSPSVSAGSPYNYSITLTKPTGCDNDAIATGTITVNPLPTFETAYTDITCFGAGNGTITVNNVSGGTSPYTFSIDNGTNYQSGNTFNSLLPAIYKIRVKDAIGCQSTVCP